MLWALTLFGFFVASAQGRAVNISNTWVLPEEGFPVFYRYFRDRISWYEADAVCQFHHANLVTVDTTAQYDAVRAYLKELDISSAVWVGLIRSNPDGDFTWTDYRGLSGDGYWSSAPDPRSAPLCAAADPAADYRWEARACGGPTVASFICELPVPQWALGNEGCMVKALPALTVLYLPESAAVQLTADCGLAGVKRVQCTGNVKREDLLTDLSCADEDEPTSTSLLSTGTNLPVSSENPFTDPDAISEATSEENITTEHEDDINQSSTAKSTAALYNTKTSVPDQTIKYKQNINNPDIIFTGKEIDLETNYRDNLQSNDIPKLAANDNFLPSELSDKIEDEKHRQHKLLHDEIAKHGNFETIFTQPTDHFVPPLVMAKSKVSDDMTVLSLEEKHAQQLAEQRYLKHLHIQDNNSIYHSTTVTPKTTGDINKDKTLISNTTKIVSNEGLKKDALKNVVPKKYDEKQFGLKSKSLKVQDTKVNKYEKTTELYPSSTLNFSQNNDSTTSMYTKENLKTNKSEDEPTIDLTVIIKEPDTRNSEKESINRIPKIEIMQNDTSLSEPEIKLINPEENNGEITQEISVKLPTTSENNSTMTHEVIKITIVNDENSSDVPTVFEVTTKLPKLKDEVYANTSNFTNQEIVNISTTKPIVLSTKTSSSTNSESSKLIVLTTPENDNNMTTTTPEIEGVTIAFTNITVPQYLYTTLSSALGTELSNGAINSDKSKNITQSLSTTTITKSNIQETGDSMPDFHPDQGDFESNVTDSSEIDDFQSPLLSGANEPLPRPNRSRRPQPPNRITKFNPFRILG